MQFLRSFLLLMTIFIVIDARWNSCPEEYREVRRRNDDSTSDSVDDDDDDHHQWQEKICEQSMNLARHQRNSIENQWMLNTFCAYYDEASELARENNDTLCQEKKRAIEMKRKRNNLKKKRDDSSINDNDDDDDDDDDQDKRQALRKRELTKRRALRFIHKRLL